MGAPVPASYEDPRAHAVRERYLATFGGPELPVPVEAIAEDLLGLRVEERPALGLSGMLLPAERRVVVNADEVAPRRRFTLAHELGHWVCQVREGAALPVYCRLEDVAESADRALEREANVFAAELLMPEPAVRAAWAELGEVAACAARFDVSPTAMHWRLYSFELVEEGPAS
jgi:hypothetical protein